MTRSVLRIATCGLWAAISLVGCSSLAPPLTSRPIRLAAAVASNQPTNPSAQVADQTPEDRTDTLAPEASVPPPEVDWVAHPEERKAEAARAIIRRHLETSRPDHYPTVEKLQVVPSIQPDTYIFIADVRVAGFTSYRYRMIGHYDRTTNVITVLEHKRDTWAATGSPDSEE